MRYIIIGDVHGMLVELQALIEKVELRPDDCIVFVGDLVDKGPSPEGVVRYVKALSEDYDVVVVEGNHEEKHRRFRKSQNMEMKGPRRSAASMTRSLKKSGASWLVLCLFIELKPMGS